MIEFAWVWLLLVIPLAWLVPFIKAKPTQSQALKLPFFDQMKSFAGESLAPSSVNKVNTVLAALIWILLVTATARPEWVGTPIMLPHKGRDILLAIDVSGSMQVKDMRLNARRVDRLTAVKSIVSQFITRREGDRLGLILFGTRAYLQAPLSFDLTSIATFLQEAVIGIAGEMTAIGDAIGLSVKYLNKQDNPEKTVILITDGANSAGEVNPINAAKVAKKENITIYTIGIGAPFQEVRQMFGRNMRIPNQELDEKTLQQIATITGGQYYRANDTNNLEAIYAKIDNLLPIESDQQLLRPKKALFIYPLALAFILSLILAIREIDFITFMKREA